MKWLEAYFYLGGVRLAAFPGPDRKRSLVKPLRYRGGQVILRPLCDRISCEQPFAIGIPLTGRKNPGEATASWHRTACPGLYFSPLRPRMNPRRRAPTATPPT